CGNSLTRSKAFPTRRNTRPPWRFFAAHLRPATCRNVLWLKRPRSYFKSSMRKTPAMPRADRGSVWLVDLGIVAKIRPCLVLSVPTDPQDRVLVTLVPHTTSVQGARFEVTVKAR